MSYKLSIEEQEYLQELLDQLGWSILMTKILPGIMKEQASRVLSVSGESEEAGRVIVIEQARYNGMQTMTKKVESLKNILAEGKTRKPDAS